MSWFWPKYIIYELKSTEELYFMTIECDTKFEEKVTCALEITWGIWQFSPEHMKFSKLRLSLDHFIQSRKCMSLKLTGELCVMTIENDAKFELELTCQFKIDIRNLTNFDPRTQKSQKPGL